MTEPSSPIPQALTPEQWAELNGPCFFYGHEKRHVYSDSDFVGIGISECRALGDARPIQSLDLPVEDRHALAALCLYEQPFGFSQADVITLRSVADDFAALWPNDDSAERLRSLASRIQGLLPPLP